MKTTLLLMSLALAVPSFAVPTASVTALSQDASTKLVTVSYTVSEAAIVTPEFFLGGSPLAGERWLDRLNGTINQEVSAGKTHSFTWAPDAVAGGLDLSGKALKVKLTAWSPLQPPPYAALDLTVTNGVRYYASSNAVPGGVHDHRYRSDIVLMRRIPAKNVVWTMGMSTEAVAWDSWAGPAQTRVKLTYDYYMAIFPMTVRQHEHLALNDRKMGGFNRTASVDDGYAAYMGRPALCMSWNSLRGTSKGANWPAADSDLDEAHAVDADSIVGKARAVTGKPVDLATEAEWEYACRAGTWTDTYNGKTIMTQAERTATSAHGRICRYTGNSNYNSSGKATKDFPAAGPLPDQGGTATVGSYEPNAWGIYDMLGQTREWVLDWYAPRSTDLVTVVENPRGPKSSTDTSPSRVYKGGCYYDGAYICCSGARGKVTPSTGTWPTGYRFCWIIK